MGYLSIYFCLFKFFSQMSHKFQSGDLSPLGFKLFLCIMLFLIYCKWDWFLDFFLRKLFVIIRNATDFCVLVFYPTALLKLLIRLNFFWLNLYIFLYIKSCHLQIDSFYFFLSSLDAFSFLAWLLWQGLSVLYWTGVVRVSTCLILDLREKVPTYHSRV